MSNLFIHDSAAKRYATGRPYFHPLAIARIREACGILERIPRALDVACGTGMSAVALLDLADEIVGTDVSPSMLAQATKHPRIVYRTVAAEALPDDLGTFDLLTIAMGFHWLDRPTFMPRARDRLRPGGWLAIYNDYFRGVMRGNDAYAAWNRDEYLRRFPTPPRSYAPMTAAEVESFGFVEHRAVQFDHDVQFNPESLTRYLLTQSNTIAAVEHGDQSAQAISQWMLESVAPFFDGRADAAFPFSCEIRIYRRT